MIENLPSTKKNSNYARTFQLKHLVWQHFSILNFEMWPIAESFSQETVVLIEAGWYLSVQILVLCSMRIFLLGKSVDKDVFSAHKLWLVHSA